MATIVEPASDFSALPEVPEGVFTAPLRRPAHVGEDWLEPAQRDYSSTDDATWNDLFERQMGVLPGRACSAFFSGLQKLHLGRGGVPEFARLSEELGALYWYTVEFGLMLEGADLRIYGAGILSGPREAVFALEAGSPNRIMLNVDRVMRTDYVIDDLQPTYFVIDSFEDLYRQTVERDFDRLYRALNPGFTYANAAVIDVDDVLHRGTQEYHLRGGRGSNADPA